MDIRSWSVDKIMQLPAHFFGRRWPVSVEVDQTATPAFFGFNEMALPNRFVIWQVVYYASASGAYDVNMEVRLGHQLSTTTAAFRTGEPLFKDLGLRDGDSNIVRITGPVALFPITLKQLVVSNGRRLVLNSEVTAGVGVVSGVILVISGVPTEIPDCLISGQGESL